MTKPPPTTYNPPLRWKSHLTAFSIGLASFGLFQLFTTTPGLIDFVYSRTLNPFLIRIASRLTGLSPIPLLEPLIVIYFGRLLYVGGKTVGAVTKRQRGFANSIAAADCFELVE